MSRTTAVLIVMLAGCAGKQPAPSSPSTAPATPEPVIGEGACRAIAECDGDRRVTCDGNTSCTAVDGLGCRGERTNGQPPELRCCDGTRSCEAGVAEARVP